MNSLKKPEVLFIGNGINRSFGESGWSDVISGLSTGEFDENNKIVKQIEKIPFGLQTIILSSDSVSDGMDMLSKKLMPKELKREQVTLTKKLVSIPFDAILTPNYSYEIETSIDPKFHLKQGCASKYRKKTCDGNAPQEQFGIYKYMSVSDKMIWHIHGEAARPSSMVMGHYYYGKLLVEIQKRIPDLIREYKTALKTGRAMKYKSWIDYFLIGNLYIIGFGMDVSEMDFWWLVNCKKRNFSDAGSIRVFEPGLGCAEKYPIKALCDTFGILYDEEDIGKYGSYRDYFERKIDTMKGIVTHSCAAD